MRVVVFGSRDFNNYIQLSKVLYKLNRTSPISTILSGCARGADSLAITWADFEGIAVERYPAEWNKFGKQAGFVRNRVMAENCDYGIAFWDGKSRGTKHMIDTCTSLSVPLEIIEYST